MQNQVVMSEKNRLYFGDNLDVLRRYVADASVDLVYLDPPFNSNASYNVLFKEHDGAEAVLQIQAFEDTWRWDENAARAGIGLVQAQRLMRHSDPKLTAMVYTHLDVIDGGAAVDKLPELPTADGESSVALPVALICGNSSVTESISGNSEGHKQDSGGKAQIRVLTNKDKACQRVARGKEWWAVQDSNLRPPACKAGRRFA